MIRMVEDAEPPTLAGFDELIDVRSPGEFAEDHAPGAINLPVLSDTERAEVGTIYVQRSKFLARRLGAAYVSRNIADHLAGPLADRDGSYAPLVYCWRGGQRSNAMATVLDQVGWRVGLLRGGYKTYRRRVMDALYGEAPLGLNLVVLGGGTGSGKTPLLGQLAALGTQVLDLEALAVHRGSLFGAIPGAPQPAQKLFESHLLAAIDALDAHRPVVVEAESSRIGELFVPPRLWKAMAAAPEIAVQAPVEARARHIAAEYGEAVQDLDAVADLLNRLPAHHSREDRAAWLELARLGDAEAFARALIEAHYDPSYQRSTAQSARRNIGAVTLDIIDPPAQARAAQAIAALVQQAFA